MMDTENNFEELIGVKDYAMEDVTRIWQVIERPGAEVIRLEIVASKGNEYPHLHLNLYCKTGTKCYLDIIRFKELCAQDNIEMIYDQREMLAATLKYS